MSLWSLLMMEVDDSTDDEDGRARCCGSEFFKLLSFDDAVTVLLIPISKVEDGNFISSGISSYKRSVSSSPSSSQSLFCTFDIFVISRSSKSNIIYSSSCHYFTKTFFSKPRRNYRLQHTVECVTTTSATSIS